MNAKQIAMRFRLVDTATGEALARRIGPGLMVAPRPIRQARVVATDEAGAEIARAMVGPMTIYESINCPAALSLAPA